MPNGTLVHFVAPGADLRYSPEHKAGYRTACGLAEADAEGRTEFKEYVQCGVCQARLYAVSLFNRAG